MIYKDLINSEDFSLVVLLSDVWITHVTKSWLDTIRSELATEFLCTVMSQIKRAKSEWFSCVVISVAIMTKESYLFTIDLNVCHIVLKHSGHINLRKLILTEDYEETGFTTGSITDYHQLLSDRSHLKEWRQSFYLTIQIIDCVLTGLGLEKRNEEERKGKRKRTEKGGGGGELYFLRLTTLILWCMGNLCPLLTKHILI